MNEQIISAAAAAKVVRIGKKIAKAKRSPSEKELMSVAKVLGVDTTKGMNGKMASDLLARAIQMIQADARMKEYLNIPDGKVDVAKLSDAALESENIGEFVVNAADAIGLPDEATVLLDAFIGGDDES